MDFFLNEWMNEQTLTVLLPVFLLPLSPVWSVSISHQIVHARAPLLFDDFYYASAIFLFVGVNPLQSQSDSD